MNTAYFRARSRRHHDGRSAAARHDAAAIHQVDPVGERHIEASQRFYRFGHRQAFAGQGGLADGKGGNADEPAIRRHDHATLQDHDVAGDDRFGRNLQFAATAQHARGVGHDAFQAAYRALRPPLGCEPDAAVKRDDCHDGARLQEAADCDGNQGSSGKERNRQAAELAKQDAQL